MIDRALGALSAGLKRLDIRGRLFLIVSADHGEAFYEHGFRFHAQTVYEEMVRVPLYIHGPGVRPRKVMQAASLMDLSPTILDLFSLDTPARYMGQSLVPFLAGRTPDLARPLAIDSATRGHVRGMLFDGHIKAIEQVVNGTEEVYDLDKDPAEKSNLAEAPRGREYLDALRAFFEIHTSEVPKAR
jgi:arylsulfatase A-like enzyme